jgi:hypothetical protein
MTFLSVLKRWRKRFTLALFIGGASIQFSIPAATAHDWYPMECCHGYDCAEVERATYGRPPDIDNELPMLTVTTKHGTALVPANFPRRESLDGKMHACMRRDQGSMRLICLFVPPPS